MYSIVMLGEWVVLVAHVHAICMVWMKACNKSVMPVWTLISKKEEGSWCKLLSKLTSVCMHLTHTDSQTHDRHRLKSINTVDIVSTKPTRKLWMYKKTSTQDMCPVWHAQTKWWCLVRAAVQRHNMEHSIQPYSTITLSHLDFKLHLLVLTTAELLQLWSSIEHTYYSNGGLIFILILGSAAVKYRWVEASKFCCKVLLLAIPFFRWSQGRATRFWRQ